MNWISVINVITLACRTIPPIHCQDVPHFSPFTSSRFRGDFPGGQMSPWATSSSSKVMAPFRRISCRWLPPVRRADATQIGQSWEGDVCWIFWEIHLGISIYGKKFREYCLFLGGAMNVHRPQAMWTLPTWMVRAIWSWRNPWSAPSISCVMPPRISHCWIRRWRTWLPSEVRWWRSPRRNPSTALRVG